MHSPHVAGLARLRAQRSRIHCAAKGALRYTAVHSAAKGRLRYTGRAFCYLHWLVLVRDNKTGRFRLGFHWLALPSRNPPLSRQYYLHCGDLLWCWAPALQRPASTGCRTGESTSGDDVNGYLAQETITVDNRLRAPSRPNR